MDIDYVVPMVFPDDPLWREDFRKCNSSYNEGSPRWRSWDTEELLTALVRKNMPWVRTIHILLARESQKQPWMDGEKIHVVYHKDFIPERLLPLFNSCAIEMFLGNIPGLSDCFVYGNDDMFPVSPLKEEDFFKEGLPCISMTGKMYPENPNIFERSCMKGLNFVANEFGIHFSNSWLKNGHGLAPICKSTCDHMWERKEDMELSVHSFRTEDDMNQYIYSWWQYLSGNYVQSNLKTTYINVSNTVSDIVKAVETADGVVCVNDNSSCSDIKPYADAVRYVLRQRLENG